MYLIHSNSSKIDICLESIACEAARRSSLNVELTYDFPCSKLVCQITIEFRSRETVEHRNAVLTSSKLLALFVEDGPVLLIFLPPYVAVGVGTRAVTRCVWRDCH